MERLTVRVNRRLNVFRKVRIGDGLVAKFFLMGFRQRNAFADLAAWCNGRFDHRNGTMILLDDEIRDCRSEELTGMQAKNVR